MNHFIEYVCRCVVLSEDAIQRLGKKVTNLAKCNRNLTASVICLGVAGILMTSVVAEQEKEIRTLKKQVSDLADKTETYDTAEEQNDQEGA